MDLSQWFNWRGITFNTINKIVTSISQQTSTAPNSVLKEDQTGFYTRIIIEQLVEYNVYSPLYFLLDLLLVDFERAFKTID